MLFDLGRPTDDEFSAVPCVVTGAGMGGVDCAGTEDEDDKGDESDDGTGGAGGKASVVLAVEASR